MKSGTITFTSTLSAALMAWLKDYAGKRETTKRAILEEALEQLKIDSKRKEYEKGYSRMAKDPDVLEWAEWGMADYHKQLKSLGL